ncbi:MAG TPA: Fur family transcriptional regulator [Spirochaetales bacterium]|nr:Fur family transcriptional regulator [Spirochaetales bacterium]HRY53810.1 Fur family transcriptional regulator [Spirochaetia bacterium]HRZ65103.1 Fur family transcriptional regulator [Spirochaetia bacterium]
MKHTAEFLRERGIQPSQQRIAIYEALASTKAHPSADLIHGALAPGMPTLSRTTVYSTLELLVERGLAQRLALTGSELRYDADVSPHLHFRCRACGSVSDLPGQAPSPPELPAGYLAERVQLYAEGLCPACSAGLRS